MNFSKITSAQVAEKTLTKAIGIAIKHDIYSGGEIHTYVQEA
jgi:hypothetical protein